MRWLKIGLALSLIGAGYGLYSSRLFPVVCCGSVALIAGLLIWVLNRQFRQFQDDFDPNRLYMTRGGYITGAQAFVRSAKELAEHSVSQAVPVPFHTKWPTYGQMDINQLDWYFYWRGQVRNGNFPKTDTTYIYLLAYELINDIGVLNLQLGYDQLLALWQNYRADHPVLDEDLADWIVDYACVNNLAPSPESVYRYLSDGKGETVDWIVQARIDDGWANLPLPILDRLTDHKIAQSSFVKAGNEELVEIAVRLLVAAVDAHLQEVEGVGIWEKYRPKSPTTHTRTPFAGAIYAGDKHTITVGELYMTSKHEPLRDFLTAVVKYTENKLREQAKFRGRLQVKGLDMSLQQLIDKIMDSKFNAPGEVKEELLAALKKIADKPVSAEIKLHSSRKKAAARAIPRRAERADFEIAGRTLAQLYNASVFRKHSFVTTAKKMADWVEAETPLVPFQKYYSSYADMLLPQLTYYFYWRNEVRAGRYPKTDTSYIFVHIYELLNNVGVANPRAGYQQLIDLWQHYDNAHPIGRYLVTWITDYLLLNPCDIDPLAVYRNPLAFRHLYSDEDINIALTTALAHPNDPIPLAILDRIVDQPLSNSQFVKAGYGEWFGKELSNALNYLETQLKAAGMQGLFEQFQSQDALLIRRAAYQGMMVETYLDPVTITGIYRYELQNGLRDALSQVVRYILQKLHEKADYRPKIRRTKLKAAFEQILTAYFEGVTFSAEKLPVPTLTKDQTDYSQKAAFEALRDSADNRYGNSMPVPLQNDDRLSYASLSGRQRGWYNYWRRRARSGNYLPTPAPYVTLFAYELLNNIGVADSYTHLLTLWQQYHSKPIGAKLASWLLGYTFVNTGGLTPQQHLLRPEVRAFAIEVAPDLILTTEHTDFTDMPLSLLSQFSEHDIAQSSFHTGDNIPLLQTYLPRAVAQVDEYAKQHTGQGLLARFTPPKGVAVSVDSCWGAYYPNWPTQIALPDIPAYSQQRSFCDLITGIVKYTENHLRQLQDVRGRLRAITLNDDVQRVLDEWFPTIEREQRPQLPKPTIEIDSSRIEQLRAESEAVFEMLNLEATHEDESPAADEADETPALPVAVKPVVVDNEWQALLQALDPPHHQLLRAILNDDEPLTQLRDIATANGTMPSVLIDTINEHAQEIIGDLLLELVPEPQFIDDEYRDNIALLF